MHEFIEPVDLKLILVSFFESVCGGVKDAMQRKIEVQTHRLDAEQRQQLERAMAFFNDAQEALALFESGPADLLTKGNTVSVENIYQTYDGPTPILFVTGLPLSDNWFTHAERGVGVLTLSDWEVAFISDANGIGLAAPDAYILTSLALAVLCIIARVADYDVIHNGVTGCLFDLCAHKPDRIFKMRSAFVCQECTALLAERGVSAVEIDAIHAVLEIVRRLVLGRKPQTYSPVAPDDLGFLKQFADSNRFALPPRLIAACRERRITLFVGSGMSLQSDVDIAYPTETSWDRLPTWTEIPHRLAARLETYVGKKVWPRDTETLDEFLIDLDFFREKLGPILYYPRAIFDIFTPEVKSVGLAHRLLFRLPLAAVLTTNYDFVLQCAAPAGSPVYTWKEARAAREYLNGGGNLKPLLKLHGCASRPDTVVLTRVEYDTLRRDHEYIALVNSLLDHHAVLFLGFGFNDPRDLDLALREAQLAGASVGEKFAVLPAAKCAEARAKFPQLQAIPIEKHEDLAPLLAELIVKSQSI